MNSRVLAAAAVSLLVCACGGGGGDSQTPAPPPPPVSLTPSPWVMTISPPGLSSAVTVHITVTNPSAFAGVSTLYVFVVDTQKVLTGPVILTQIDSLNYSALVNTSSSLAVGRYQGTFQVQLCKDAACTMQIGGSPIALPYDWTLDNSSFGMGVGGSTTVSMTLGGAAPPDWTFTASTGLAWVATTNVAWLRVNGGAGVGIGTFTVSVLPAGLAVGTYTAPVTLTLSDGRSTSINLTLNITP